MIDGNDILELGIPEGPLVGKAIESARRDEAASEKDLLALLEKAWDDPEAALDAGRVTAFARAVKEKRDREALRRSRAPLDEPIPYDVWGAGGIDDGALEQMEQAMRLPVTRAGALMPDAHVGYGLPVGGVLAMEGAVAPYMVGVDISCSMALSLFPDDPNRILKGHKDKTVQALQRETAFGMGSGFEDRHDHAVMDRAAWNELPMIGSLKSKAHRQLGSSGGGNHFVEFGVVELREELDTDDDSLQPGKYLALLSHSGSRGLGYKIAERYTDIAKEECLGLPDDMKHLAWLDLDSEAGREYWALMNFARDYTLANHQLIHKHVARATGIKPVFYHDHSHNLAFKEEHDGEELIVHRKGATPAAEGQLGLIPGTMGDRGYIVSGKGEARSLASSSHGAGRRMSRREAHRTLTKSSQKKYLNERGITLIGGDVDEHPMAYKRIDEVIAEQRDLVDVVGTFSPRIVRMAE
jgi:tRNA-splicing ligase RtcB